MTKPFDVLALRMMILNLHSYAQKISEGEAMDTKVRHIPYGSPGYNRAYLGPFPVLIDDASRLVFGQATCLQRRSYHKQN